MTASLRDAASYFIALLRPYLGDFCLRFMPLRVCLMLHTQDQMINTAHSQRVQARVKQTDRIPTSG